MRPLNRKPVSKGKSARQFRGNSAKTHPNNVRGMPMRGGIRL